MFQISVEVINGVDDADQVEKRRLIRRTSTEIRIDRLFDPASTRCDSFAQGLEIGSSLVQRRRSILEKGMTLPSQKIIDGAHSAAASVVTRSAGTASVFTPSLQTTWASPQDLSADMTGAMLWPSAVRL